MAASEDIDSWAARQKLPAEVTRVLKDNGFQTTDDVAVLTPADVKEVFQESGLLNIAQSLQLKRAVLTLTEATAPAPSPAPHSAPPWSTSELNGPQPQPYPPQPQPYPPQPRLYPSLSYPPQPQPYPLQSQPYPSVPVPGSSAPYPSQGQQMRAHPQPYAQPGPSAAQPAWGGVPGAEMMPQEVHSGVEGSAGGSECFRFLLLGKTGSGKSTTGNTIFGENVFDTAPTFASVTAECERKTNKRGGRKFEIIDSPGLYDTRKTNEEICVLIVQAVAGMHPGPHAILYVVRLGRYTAEEYAAYQRLKALFDETISRYLIVVFTHGDMLEREHKSITDLIGTNAPQTLHQVLKECNNRYIVFNNVAPDPQPQVEHLLQMVRQMVAYNGDKPYSCPKYFSIGEGMEEEVTRRLQEVEKRDLQRQKYVQQLEQQTQEAEEAARRTLEQFEKNEEERQRRMEEEEDRRRQLEEQLQTHIREQQIGFERYQEELQRLQEERETQERTMKEKEAEMTEQERRRAEEETQRMRQREQELAALMEKQEERLRRQREEDEERRHQLERERQEFMQQMEEQRRKDREEVERRDEERERLWEQHREEERQAAEEREENYEKEMEKLKGQIVTKQATDFINTVASAFCGIVRLLVDIDREETERERAVRYRDDPFLRPAAVTFPPPGLSDTRRLGSRSDDHDDDN